MPFPRARLCFVPVAWLLASAAPGPAPLELVREGNAAFDRKDYPAALQLYASAEARTDDPGLVAFNEAAALYRLGDYRAAELHYRRALEGAAGERRRYALAGLGDALLRRSGGVDVATLRLAAESYRLCLREAAGDATLADDVRHNLELARLLLARARAANPDEPPPNTPEDDPNGGKSTKPGATEEGQGEPGDIIAAEPLDKDGPNASNQGKAAEAKQPLPGQGNLPTLPDSAELVPLPPEDTLAYLRQVRERILRQRRADWESAAGPAKGVKDW